MQPDDLRIALFSGNYNYVRDGANQALNRLVGYLLRQGAQVRIYSPTVDKPAFQPTGDLVSVPAFSDPDARGISDPDGADRRGPPRPRGIRAQRRPCRQPGHRRPSRGQLGAGAAIPAVASVHTRFETYLAILSPAMAGAGIRAILRRFYRRCDAIVVAPAESTAAILRAQRMNSDISIWTRGVDRDQFNPGRRDMDWRRALGIADDEMVVAFLGRIVMEKGLDVFADAIDALRSARSAHVLVIGEGPARPWFEERLPDAVFTGQLVGTELGRALASADVLLNPSITEAFGNVTLEAMACGAAGRRRGRDRRDQPGARRRDRDPGRSGRHRRLRRRARGLCPRPRAARAPRRGRPGLSPRRWTGTRSTAAVLQVYRAIAPRASGR